MVLAPCPTTRNKFRRRTAGRSRRTYEPCSWASTPPSLMFHPVSRLPNSRRPALTFRRPLIRKGPPPRRRLRQSRMRLRPTEAKPNHEPRDSPDRTSRIRRSRAGGAVAEALAHCRCGRRPPVRHRCSDLSGPVPARLSDRLHFLAGSQSRLPGFVDGAVPFRRTVGLSAAPGIRSRLQMPSADVRVVSADPVGAPPSLRVDDRSGAHRAQWLVPAHLGLGRLDRPLDPLFRHLGMVCLHADSPWRSTGPPSAAGRFAPLPGAKRPGAGAVFLDGVIRRGGLGHVARSPLGLDHLWAHLHRRARPVGTGVWGCDAHAVYALQPVSRNHQADAVPRYRQIDADVRDVVRLLLLFAVAHHLGGQSAGRDWLVSAPHTRGMGRGGADYHSVSLCPALRAAIVAGTQTRRQPHDWPGNFSHLHAAGGHLLVCSSELCPRTRTLLPQPLVHRRAHCGGRVVANLLLLQPTAAAIVAAV